MWALSERENWMLPGDKYHIVTLGADETAAADNICEMLRRASAWGRRGWLVMMRARYLVAAQLLDESLSEKPSPVEEAEDVHGAEATGRKPSHVCVAVEGLTSLDAPSTDPPGRLNGHEKNVAFRDESPFAGRRPRRRKAGWAWRLLGVCRGVAPALSRRTWCVPRDVGVL